MCRSEKTWISGALAKVSGLLRAGAVALGLGAMAGIAVFST
jgi:hypothetical protein